jgi:hypothetical protein
MPFRRHGLDTGTRNFSTPRNLYCENKRKLGILLRSATDFATWVGFAQMTNATPAPLIRSCCGVVVRANDSGLSSVNEMYVGE